MAEHRNLTGIELHEPKGVETATSGQVYVADGAGSGAWTSKNEDNLIFNTFILQGQLTDISTANDNAYFYIPVKSEIRRLTAILHGPITTANSILSIYINGVLFTDSLTVNYVSSSAGQRHTAVIVTSNTVNADSVIEIRTDGGSDTVTKATIQLEMKAKA